MNNIKTYNNFIKETKNYPYVYGILDKNDINLVISKEELDDQFLRLREVLHYSYNIVYYVSRSPNTQNDKTYYYVKFDKIIRVETNEYSEIIQIKKRMEHMFPVILKFNRYDSIDVHGIFIEFK